MSAIFLCIGGPAHGEIVSLGLEQQTYLAPSADALYVRSSFVLRENGVVRAWHVLVWSHAGDDAALPVRTKNAIDKAYLEPYLTIDAATLMPPEEQP